VALIELHPEVDDYIVQLTLPEIVARGGVEDLVEQGMLVIIKDFRLDADYSLLQELSKSTEAIDDSNVRRHLKKLEAPTFFESQPSRWPWRKRRFSDPIQQALLDALCRGDVRLYEQAAGTLRSAHDQALRVFEACFGRYETFRFVPSVRLTRTFFENLHWDDHSIDDDFHTARVFANLDVRPRIWHVSHRFPDIMRLLYREHDLGRFAGRDPNELVHYINSEVLGGQSQKWRDALPRHRIAFEPGEVWVGESRLVSHQIYYGEAALVYMWFVRIASMVNPENRFNARVEQVHREMACLAAEPAKQGRV
jgi:hypothetical protein